MQTITILGTGRAGGALAIALDGAGRALDRLIFRTRPSNLAELSGFEQIPFDEVRSVGSAVLIIATPDPEIRGVAERIAELKVLPKIVLHLSGSLSSAELQPLKTKGVAVGSMHPLASISDPVLGSMRLSGSYFCVEGDPAAVEAATDLVAAIDGKPFFIDTAFKPLYHASAVMASGNITALFDAAIEMLSKCGLTPGEAHSVLLPLLEGAVANLSGQSTAEALTGPFVRGDIETFHRHLAAFEGMIEEDLRRIYLLLAQRSVDIVGRSPGGHAAELSDAISVAKQKTGC